MLFADIYAYSCPICSEVYISVASANKFHLQPAARRFAISTSAKEFALALAASLPLQPDVPWTLGTPQFSKQKQVPLNLSTKLVWNDVENHAKPVEQKLVQHDRDVPNCPGVYLKRLQGGSVNRTQQKVTGHRWPAREPMQPLHFLVYCLTYHLVIQHSYWKWPIYE